MKKIWNNYKLQMGYVILLTAMSPLAFLWILFVGKVLEIRENSGGTLGTIFIVFLPVVFYFLLLFVLGIKNIIAAFKMYKTKGVYDCLNGMLIHKYGLVVFFVLNFLVIFLFYFLITIGVFMGTRGMAILFSPVLLPWLAIAVFWSCFFTWLAILPGSFYSFQVIRASYKEHKTGIGGAFLHTILQVFFLVDVLDSMYLAAKLWGRGKKSSIAVGMVYLAGIVGIIWIIIKLQT